MVTPKPLYHELLSHYEKCFDQHGATPQGVDWPNQQDLWTRFAVMLDICNGSRSDSPLSLLDLGCGYGALLDYIKTSTYKEKFHYHGIDLSEKMIRCAIQKFGASHFEQRDILVNKLDSDSVDYIIMNGLFTEKRGMSQAEMEAFFTDMLSICFQAARKGMAFNVMSFHVDWFREDLFHLAFDRLALLLKKHCGRHFTIRADYGLYEYTVYVYKQPNDQVPPAK